MSRCAVSQQTSWRAPSVFRQSLSLLRSRARRSHRPYSLTLARPLQRRLRRRRRRKVMSTLGGSASPKAMPKQLRRSRLISSRSENAIHLAVALAFVVAIHLQAAEVTPPKPDRYFNDYAGVVSKTAADRFNAQLA